MPGSDTPTTSLEAQARSRRRRPQGRRTGVTVASLALGIAISGLGSAASALDCPVAHPVGSSGVLREGPEQIAKTSSTLAHHGAAAVPYMVADLKRRRPAASKGEILNYLITAYCPVVNAENGKSDRQKRRLLEAFDRKAQRIVYK